MVAKIVLRKDKVEKYRAEFVSAVSLLTLSHQILQVILSFFSPIFSSVHILYFGSKLVYDAHRSPLK